MNYQIAVTPDANSGSGFTEGTVQTTYAGSLMEGQGSGAYFNRDWYSHGAVLYPKGTDIDWDGFIAHWGSVPVDWVSFKPSATNNWKDSTTATGGIRTFQKAFAYKSGFKI